MLYILFCSYCTLFVFANHSKPEFLCMALKRLFFVAFLLPISRIAKFTKVYRCKRFKDIGFQTFFQSDRDARVETLNGFVRWHLLQINDSPPPLSYCQSFKVTRNCVRGLIGSSAAHNWLSAGYVKLPFRQLTFSVLRNF